MKIPFIGGSNEGRSTDVSSETCINWFYEKADGGESLVPTPGRTLFSSPTTGEVRGAITYNDNAFFVIDSGLYEVSPTGDHTLRGSLSSTSGS